MSIFIEVIKILIIATFSFIVAFILTPVLTHYLYKYKMGKQIRKDGAPIFYELHKEKAGTPTMGGIIIWLTVLIVSLLFYFLPKIGIGGIFEKLNFLTRPQTLLPLGAMVISAIFGLFDDILGILGIGPKGGGIRMRYRFLLYALVAIGGAWWFYDKLDWDIIKIPFLGSFDIGIWYIPIFIFVIVATAFSSNETDGLDGLAGGILLIAFAMYGAISFYEGRYDLATFCGAIAGALVAFLWFNIHPARFFMGDTGSMSLGVTLGVIAMLTNAIAVLPLIGLIMVVESGSVIIQVLSKKIRHKKVFLSTPIHHHFQAIGWPETKVVMRFWIIGAVFAIIGLIVVLVGDKIVF